MSTYIYTYERTGGGHGEIGFHLAKQLTAKGVKVTILNDQYNEKKQPFKVRTAAVNCCNRPANNP